MTRIDFDIIDEHDVEGDPKIALQFGKHIISTLDDIPDNDAAVMFADDVESKVSGVMEWIDIHNHVTEKQARLLVNTYYAIKKWLH